MYKLSLLLFAVLDKERKLQVKAHRLLRILQILLADNRHLSHLIRQIRTGDFANTDIRFS